MQVSAATNAHHRAIALTHTMGSTAMTPTRANASSQDSTLTLMIAKLALEVGSVMTFT